MGTMIWDILGLVIMLGLATLAVVWRRSALKALANAEVYRARATSERWNAEISIEAARKVCRDWEVKSRYWKEAYSRAMTDIGEEQAVSAALVSKSQDHEATREAMERKIDELREALEDLRADYLLKHRALFWAELDARGAEILRRQAKSDLSALWRDYESSREALEAKIDELRAVEGKTDDH